MFRDRTEAGERLADELERRGVDADLVLAIPRGALPLGRVVADRLAADLDVIVAKKLGAPHNSELAIGAVAENGEFWLNDDMVGRIDLSESYVQGERERVQEAAVEKARKYREGPPPELAGKRVVVVDDGVATGATMRACLMQARSEAPARLTVAVPVGPMETAERLGDLADDVIVLETPQAFRAVGAYYSDFGQVQDEEAMAYLDRENATH